MQAQFGRYEEQKEIRQENLDYLNKRLGEIEGIEPLADDADITSHACHLYIFRYKKEAFANKPKERFIEAMKGEGIPSSTGYSLPLYKQPVFLNKAFGPRGKTVDLPVDYAAFNCPETEKACVEEAIWFTQNMLLGTRQDMDDIVTAVKKIGENAGEM